MAKVGKKTVEIAGKWIQLSIKYTSKKGFEVEGLPSDIFQLTEFGREYYLREFDLMLALEKAIREYHEKIKKQRKVIAYKLVASASFRMNEYGEGRWSGKKEGVSDKFKDFSGMADAKYAFGFSYLILMETESNGEKYNTIKKDGTLGYDQGSLREYQIIEWSPEREKFFEDLKEQMFNLVKGMSSFFDAPDMLSLIDTHGIKSLKNG